MCARARIDFDLAKVSDVGATEVATDVIERRGGKKKKNKTKPDRRRAQVSKSTGSDRGWLLCRGEHFQKKKKSFARHLHFVIYRKDISNFFIIVNSYENL